jgi:hypothetical protein
MRTFLAVRAIIYDRALRCSAGFKCFGFSTTVQSNIACSGIARDQDRSLSLRET